MQDTVSAAIALTIANTNNGQSVIYVTQDASKNTLDLTLTYTGDTPITLVGGTPVAEATLPPTGPTSLYFTVSRVLTAAEFAAIVVTPPTGWQVALIDSWVLTPIADIVLQPGASIVFALGGITASGQIGPGSFNVDSYNFPQIADNGVQLPLSLQALPNAHKRLADAMSTAFVGGNQVYIDTDDVNSIPSNTLVLQFDNLTTAPLVPPGTPPGSPAFYLSFVSAQKGPGYGALTTIDNLKNVRVQLAQDYGTDWQVQDHSQDSPPYWAIIPQSPEILGTQATAIAEFRITRIVTDFPPSSTNLYVQSSGIPGYDDASITLSISKVVPALAIQNLYAETDNVPSGSVVDLDWATFNATRCAISPIDGGEAKAPTQSNGFPVPVARTTTFTLTAYNDPLGTRTSLPVTVNVQPVAVTTQLTATPATGVHYGDQVSLSWAFASAQSCSVAPPINGSTTVPAQSSGTIVYPTAAITYTITAQGQGGPLPTALTLTPIPNGWQDQANAGLWDTFGRPVLVPDFLGQLWFYAGGPEAAKSVVYTTRDGFDWSIMTNTAAFSPRGSAAGCLFANKLWLFGGATLNGQLLDEIWSSADGITWTQVQAGAHWSPRAAHGCVALAGELYVIGGVGADGAPLADVWSSTDGVSWTQVTAAAPWGARSAFGIAAFNDSIVLIAGQGANGPLADAWQSSDGLYWQGFGTRTPWQARSNPNVAAIGSRLYVVGGTNGAGTALADSNSADANGDWQMGVGPNWDASLLNISGAPFLGGMWFAGGAEAGTTNTTIWGYGP